MAADANSDRSRWWWLALAAALLAAAAYEGWGRPALRARSLPTGNAEWIWAQVEPDEGWVGFFAVRDFEIEEPPSSRSRLILGADENYVAYLNGHVVGSGGYLPGAALDAYDVTPILVKGLNRVVIELRSTHSVGALLLRLESDEGPLVVSDGSWSIVHEYREDLKWPGRPTEDVSPVASWGRPPSGRWGAPEAVRQLPRLRDQLLSRRPLPAASVRLGPGRTRWKPLPKRADRERPLGRWLTFDFGREISGFVNLVPAHRGGTRGLFWMSTEAPPDPRSSRPTGRLLALVGQGSWTDASPRRFRYVTIVSHTEIAAARAFLLEPELEEDLVVRESAPRGVLGLQPPPLRSPVEDEFWSEFERSADVGVGKDL